MTLLASDAFITPNELKNILEDKNLIIIDVADSAKYETSHINNAINSNVLNFVDKESKYSLMKSPVIIESELRELSIDQDSKVVIYSHNTIKGILHSSYLAFILIYCGFENVSILDGGYMAWVFENELLTSSLPQISIDEGNIVVNANHEILAPMKYIQNNLSSSTILDARSPQKYFGTQRSNNVIAIGHISNAKSSFYQDKFLRDNVLRDQQELDEIFIKGHELKISDEVIIYSDTVFSASMEFYILYKHMGFKNTKLYEASFLEWGNALDLPITRYRWE